MAYKFRGKTDDGSTFGARLPSAPNFMAALATASKMIGDKLGGKAGTVVKFSLGIEEATETFAVRKPKAKKEKK